MRSVDQILARSLITPWFCQSMTMRPNRGRLSNHWCKRRDPLENKNAARRMKGVVGKIGRKIPTMPIANATQPPAMKAMRIGVSSAGEGSDMAVRDGEPDRNMRLFIDGTSAVPCNPLLRRPDPAAC